jgi:RHS repeat-associated protein
VWKWDQAEPFGANQPNTDADGDGVGFDFPLRFPGQYFDRETGLAYNVFRNYDPSGGRFIESDLLGLLSGPNTYLYALASPLTGFDPLGLITCFSNPPNFNSAGCALLSKMAKDRDEFSPEEITDEQQIGPRIKFPDYKVSVKGSRPDKKQRFGGMPIRPDIEFVGYFVYEAWYTQYTTNRRGVTDFTELWRCPGQHSCGPNDPVTQVLTTCIGDWIPYRNRTSYWMRSYYEAVK